LHNQKNNLAFDPGVSVSEGLQILYSICVSMMLHLTVMCTHDPKPSTNRHHRGKEHNENKGTAHHNHKLLVVAAITIKPEHQLPTKFTLESISYSFEKEAIVNYRISVKTTISHGKAIKTPTPVLDFSP